MALRVRRKRPQLGKSGLPKLKKSEKTEVVTSDYCSRLCASGYNDNRECLGQDGKPDWICADNLSRLV